jgi:hypothetical protein
LSFSANLFSSFVLRTLSKVITILLLALWLPVTQHCGLEAAGIVPVETPHADGANCCETSDRCTHDGCDVVENDWIKPSTDTFEVPAPTLIACTCFLCLQLVPSILSDEPTMSVADFGQPYEWVPVWQFVHRAAPLSRAPSLLA